MAILQRVAVYPQERLDVPDFRAIESFGLNDWRFFLKGVMSAKSLIISGFDCTNYQNIFTVPGVKLQCNNVALIHPEATTQAGGFYVSSGSEADFNVILNPNTTNFVELDLKGIGGARDIRAFWDQGANGGKGGEYTDTVDTVINLELDIKVNVSGFNSGAIPLYKITTNADGVVTSFTDCRPMFFRLGAGGTTPDPDYEYQFRNLPDQTHARLETPVTATSATAQNSPFQGGDKNIRSFKEWMDLVMTQIKKGMAVPYWYMKPVASQAGAYQNAAMTFLVGGRWSHLGKGARVMSVDGNDVKVQEGFAYTPSYGQFTANGIVYTYSSYDDLDGIFYDVTPPPTSIEVGTPILQGSFGHLKLTDGSTLIRLGQNNSSLQSFNDIDLKTHNTLFIILSSDGSSITYGMGEDGVAPISPQTITALTTNSLTVGLNGNYIESASKLMIRGQEFSYTSYSTATGLFQGISPDPTGLVQAGDRAFQANAISGIGYYHIADSADLPSTVEGISEGVEKTYWLAYYDGNATVVLRDSEIISGESVEVGDDTSDQIFQYIGSTGASDFFPIYDVHSIADGTNLTKAIKTAYEIIETPIYDEIIEDTANMGWASGTTIYLPPNSKVNNAQASYTLGTDELEIYRDGEYLRKGYDYEELTSQSIRLKRDIFSGSYLRFRIASVGGAGAAAGGGAGADLQAAYQNGRQIVTIVGEPVTIDGPTGEKLFHVKGDVQIDGLLDPTGVELTPSPNPIPIGKVGIWVNDYNKRLMFTRADGTIIPIGDFFELLDGESQYFARNKTNATGSTIPAGAPVYIKSDGTVGLADADDEASATFFGIAAVTIPDGESGKIIYTGVVPGILAGLGLTTGTYLWLSSTPGGMTTEPPFTQNAHLRIIGIVDGDDLILQQQHNGQLG